MLGSESVPHWFRRAISLLNTDASPQWRAPAAGSAAARRNRTRPAPVPRSQGRGPKVLEEIVTSWEVQQRLKRAEAAAPRRPRRIW